MFPASARASSALPSLSRRGLLEIGVEVLVFEQSPHVGEFLFDQGDVGTFRPVDEHQDVPADAFESRIDMEDGGLVVEFQLLRNAGGQFGHSVAQIDGQAGRAVDAGLSCFRDLHALPVAVAELFQDAGIGLKGVEVCFQGCHQFRFDRAQRGVFPDPGELPVHVRFGGCDRRQKIRMAFGTEVLFGDPEQENEPLELIELLISRIRGRIIGRGVFNLSVGPELDDADGDEAEYRTGRKRRYPLAQGETVEEIQSKHPVLPPAPRNIKLLFLSIFQNVENSFNA